MLHRDVIIFLVGRRFTGQKRERWFIGQKFFYYIAELRFCNGTINEVIINAPQYISYAFHCALKNHPRFVSSNANLTIQSLVANLCMDLK